MMRQKWRFQVVFFFICASCVYFNPTPADIINALQEENSRPLTRAKVKNKLENLQSQLQIIQLKDKGIHRDWLPILFVAISRYQFYFFIEPNDKRFHQLKKYYAFIDNYAHIYLPGKNFQKLRKLLIEVERRSIAARYHLKKLREYWKQHPDKHRKFMDQLKAPEEVGGVIFYSSKNGISYKFLEDSHRKIYRQCLDEFKKNDFENIDVLEKAFLARLKLHKVRNDSTSKNYADSISAAAHYHFKQLRSYKNFSSPFPKASLAKIKKSKKALLFLGLEKLLLRQTYFFDKKPYLYREDTAFFFHSHPYKRKYPYAKPPSGQDEEMTLRVGPSLVFDVHKKCVVVFMVVLGKSSSVHFQKVSHRY